MSSKALIINKDGKCSMKQRTQIVTITEHFFKLASLNQTGLISDLLIFSEFNNAIMKSSQ